MKKICFFLMIFILLFLIGCQEEKLTINLEYNNNQYELITKEDNIKLSDYIQYTKEYKIIYLEKEYSSNDDPIFILQNGNNIFTVKLSQEEYTISIFKEYDCKVTIIDDNKEIIDVLTYKYNTTLSTSMFNKKYQKEGYEFLDTVDVYYDLEDDSKELKKINEITLEKDIYIKFNYLPLSYNIKLIIDGEEKQITITTGEKINFGSPTKKGYNFLGWYSNDTLITEETIYKPSLGGEFEAKFSKNTYTLVYKYLEEQNVINYEYNQEIKEFIPEIEGYNFLGWYLNDKLFTADKYIFDHNITLVAKLEEIKKTEINLETFGGKLNNDIIIDENGNITLPLPEKEGYTFKYWCNDVTLKNEINNLTEDSYNGETLYAYYELNDENLKSNVVVTKYNEHASDYKELAMFDNTQSGFTSLYWHKIAIKKNDNNSYYVSNIAKSGDKLSTLGEYDYVVLAYSGYPFYNEFVNMDCYIGYEVKFLIDPSSMNKDNNINIISFVCEDVPNINSEVTKYLEEMYSSYKTVNSNITLVKQYNNNAITWKTSNREIISTNGTYKKPYMTRDVTLSAYIGEDKVYEFTVNVKGETDTSTALSTGYIYTPYNTITQNAMDMLDIIYIAFLEIDNNGNWSNLSRVTNNINNYIRDKANKSGTKIVVSVNQSTSTAFPNVAASEELRKKLASNIVQVIKDLKLDGVDIDWETPTSAQATTFTLLMKEIHTQVKAANKDYLVTAAIGGGKWQPPKYDLPNSRKYLDYINLMTYSMTSGDGYFQNSLYPSTRKRTLVSCSIDESVKLYNSYGILNSQILVGIPFYVNLQKNCEGAGTLTGTGGAKWYSVMLNDYKLSSTMKEYFDDECGVPYRYDPTTKIFISYDNEQSIKVKCEYINTLGLAGIMYWQYGQDVNDMLTNAIEKYINK